jgi:2-polyprenyl-6-methoxyphenol hydroxylase-like FAD-dependent oxidoreductase
MPIGQGRVCWYATRNGPPVQPEADAGRKAEVLGLFGDWHRPIPALLEATRESDILKNAAWDRPGLRQWGRGAVTLLGDSAHPMTPNVGQGAGMAIEDAACLAKMLGGTAEVAASFRAYEKTRQTRTASIARQARRIGMIGQWSNPLMVRGRNFVTRLALARPPDGQLNAMYAYKG